MELLIKHESAPAAFVANLEKALKLYAESQGYKLTPIVEATLPDTFKRILERASQDAKILLIATQKDLESGWFRENVGLGAELIIAFFGRMDPAIIDAFGGLNFSADPDTSRHAFKTLCHELELGDTGLQSHTPPPPESLAPGFYEPETDPSADAASSFYQEIFDRLNVNPTLLLLAQSGRGERAFAETLHERAREHYGRNQALSMMPPSSLTSTLEDLFIELGRACGFEGIERQLDWESRLKAKIESDGRVFLSISRFEHASEQSRRALGKALRGLSEELPWGSLHIVVSGGVGLAELKYIVAEHSFLDHADSMMYPDLSAEDLIQWTSRDLQAALPTSSAEALLHHYGGHPGLLRQALGVLKRLGIRGENDDLLADINEAEAQHRWFDPYFLPFRRKPEYTRRVCQLLRQPDSLGRFSYWPDDEVLHKLFWGNLIRRDGDEFQWRSPTIISAGLEILGCNTSDPG